MPVSDVLARELTAHRAPLNRRFAEARRRFPALDPAAFAGFVEAAMDPVSMAVAKRAPDRLSMVVDAAFDAALEIVGQGHVGAHVIETWRVLGPALAHLVAEAPRTVLGSLSNAAITIGNHPGARWAEWLACMVDMAPLAGDWDNMLRLGQVFAWRAGLVHFRQGAIEAADALPQTLALRAVGARADEQWPDVRAAFQRDPWYAPGTTGAQTGWRTGAFIGFGGPFPLPPHVRAHADGFVVKSGGRHFHLLADAFGVALLPAAQGEADHAARNDGRMLKSDERSIARDLPEEGAAIAWNDHTLVVSSAFSYVIRVYPRREWTP